MGHTGALRRSKKTRAVYWLLAIILQLDFPFPTSGFPPENSHLASFKASAYLLHAIPPCHRHATDLLH